MSVAWTGDGSIIESDYSWLNCAEQTILLFCVTVSSSDKGTGRQSLVRSFLWSRIIISDDTTLGHHLWHLNKCLANRNNKIGFKTNQITMWCLLCILCWGCSVFPHSPGSDYSWNKYLAYRGKNCADQTVAWPPCSAWTAWPPVFWIMLGCDTQQQRDTAYSLQSV